MSIFNKIYQELTMEKAVNEVTNIASEAAEFGRKHLVTGLKGLVSVFEPEPEEEKEEKKVTKKKATKKKA